jgi:hypothetical protein
MTTASVISTTEAKAKSAKNPPPLPEQIIDALISHLSAEVTIPLTKPPFASQSLTIQLLTPLSSLETRFRVTVTGPLATSCKPPPNPSTVDEVKGYVLWATACALAGAFVDANEQLHNDRAIIDAGQVNKGSGDTQKEEEESASGLCGWQLTHNPTVLRKSFRHEKDSKELAFKVISIPGDQHTVKVKASYKFVSGQQLIGRENGAITHVWNSGTARDDTVVQQNREEEDMQLRQFVENIGKWSQPSPDTTYELGDGYEQTSLEWN